MNPVYPDYSYILYDLYLLIQFVVPRLIIMLFCVSAAGREQSAAQLFLTLKLYYKFIFTLLYLYL